MSDMNHVLSHEEREALKQDFLSSLHCALPGLPEVEQEEEQGNG